MPVDRRKAERSGHWAEHAAVLALRLKGYRLLARRFKTPRGEVDLIMRRGDVTAFIEVKRRATAQAALEAVTFRQKQRVAAAARMWMGGDPRAAEGVCRFDIVAVAPYQWPLHIPDAFSVNE
jgi:putative endonuclease